MRELYVEIEILRDFVTFILILKNYFYFFIIIDKYTCTYNQSVHCLLSGSRHHWILSIYSICVDHKNIMKPYSDVKYIVMKKVCTLHYSIIKWSRQHFSILCFKCWLQNWPRAIFLFSMLVSIALCMGPFTLNNVYITINMSEKLN